ncbi:hypothetical protein F4779DRAFT_584902 [Xylariaceae sp. FL0662B]|nr:hypothetical protein F4779DRAFT_584902 [Xylariaceae sp. FL0662B]
MTRNNLHEHLTWLLVNVALTAPNAPVLPPAHDQPDGLSPSDTTPSFPSSTNPNSETRTSDPFASSLYPTLPVTRTPGLGRTDGAAELVAGPHEVPERQVAGEKMGRLVSKSGSNRPNLVLRQEQLLTPKSTSTSGAGSLTKEYTALLKSSSFAASSTRKRTSPRHQSFRGRSENPFMTPGPTLASDHAFDTVDLTRDDDQTSPASVAFGSTVRLWREDYAARAEPASTRDNSVVFGSDVMVWQEDYAARPEPLPTTENSVAFGSDAMVWEEEHAARPEPLTPKRGKKRKSDQISQPPTATSSDDFPDIYELLSDDEVLKSRSRRSPTKSPAKTKLKTRASQTPSRAPGAANKEADRQDKLEVDLSSDSLFVSQRATKRSPLKTPRKNKAFDELVTIVEGKDVVPPQDVAPGDDSIIHSVQKTPHSRTIKRDDRVIQDSDDEFMTPLAYNVPASTARSGGRPKASLRGLQDVDDVVAYDTPSKPRQTAPSEGRMPFRSPRRHEQATSPSAKTNEGHRLDLGSAPSQEFQPASQTNLPTDDEEKSAILQLFLAQPLIIEVNRRLISERLQQNKAAYTQSLLKDDREPRSRLKQEKERLVRQQAALDALSGEFRLYEEIQNKKDALITRISDNYEQDLNTDDDEARLAELQVLLQGRQSSLQDSLFRAGINDRSAFKDNETQLPEVERTEPVVRATQLSRSVPPPHFSREATLVPRGSTQVILQTQFPQDADPTRLGQAYDEAPLQSSIGQHRRRIPSPARGHEDTIGRQSSFPEPRSEFTRSPTRQKSTIGLDLDPYSFSDDGNDLFEDSLPPPRHRTPKNMTTMPPGASTKSRKSPAKALLSHQVDYQSDYSDDIDMAQFAKEYDRQQSSSESTQPKPHRSVLSETSGNAVVGKEKSSVAKTVDPLMTAHIPRELRNQPWFKDVRKALKDRFRMTGFRHNQLEAIDATLAGKDAFILMPTGGGKSLCYQLPAVISSGKTQGVTVVVSPLISLMQDQVDHLSALNIQAATFSGERTAEQRNDIMAKLKERYPEQWLQLLYVTPEMINKSKAFLNGLNTLYRNKKLARLVIDEAHCVSQWGHDFRPDYKELGSFRERFPEVPLMALTATATQNVIMDVKHNLGIEECSEFSQSFNRPNLYYAVLKKEKNNVEAIADLINTKYDGKTGIVYTLSRKSAENIAKKLRGHGIAAHHYHANVDAKEKTRIQKDWQKGRIKVVVATIAFGMGIDKPDVRFVIHQSIPKSLEGYYQETGRAGRDGLPSECYLYFGYQDVTSLRKMINDGDGSEEQKERQRNMLNTVTAFCDNQSDCRRVEILRYFGEPFNKAQCGATCDNCQANDVFEQKDFTEYAVAVLRTIKSQSKLTLNQCTDFLMGKKKLSDYKPGAEEYHGMAKQMPRHEIHRIIDRLVAEGALKEDNVINKRIRIAVQYFRTGSQAYSFLNNRRKLFLTTRVKGNDSQRGTSRVQTLLSKPAAPATRRNPPSTNVSSPVREKRRQKKGKAVASSDHEESEDDYSKHSNGYARDGFVVADDDESDDDFETMPPPRSRRRPPQKHVGPPISHDVRMRSAQLSEIHDDIVHSFFVAAKDLEEKLRNSRNLTQPIFSELQLREMAINWTVSLDEMRSIPGINSDKVERFGKAFLPLIQQYHREYLAIMGGDTSPESTIAGPSGSRNVVDLVTDDEMEDIDDERDDDDGEVSGYFHSRPPAETPSLYDKLGQVAQKAARTSRGRSGSSAPRPSSKSTYRGKQSFSKPRKASGTSSRGKSQAGVGKKKAAGGRRTASGASSRATAGPSGGRAKSQGGFSGIGLMEH